MFIIDVFYVLSQVDSFALARRLWLHDQRHLRFILVNVFLPRGFQFANVCWEKPRAWVKVELLWKEISEGIEVLGKRVLPREGLHPREMICSLVGLHAHDSFRRQAVVAPKQIRVVNVVLLNSHLKVVLDDLPKDGVLGVEAVYDELRLAEPNRLFIFSCLSSSSCCDLRATKLTVKSS